MRQNAHPHADSSPRGVDFERTKSRGGASARHGGARVGAGRPALAARRIKRSITLSAPTDARVVAARHAHETYSETVERVLRAVRPWQMVQEPLPTAVVALLAGLRPERTAMAVVYRSLCWTRQTLEQVVQTYRAELARLGVRLHVATKDVAGGRKEGYITIDGMRYSAISVDEA